MKASAIIKAMRQRLEDAGYTVVLFRAVDLERDTLPVAAVFFDRDQGESTETDEFGPQKKTMNLDVIRVAEGTGEDPEIEALEAAEDLSAALLSNSADQLDRIDRTCRYAEETSLTIETREDYDSPIISHVKIRAHY